MDLKKTRVANLLEFQLLIQLLLILQLLNNKLRIKTKALIYKTCILSTLLYGSETWTLYAGQERRLNSFHMRCLRNILKIEWWDRILNTEMLKRACIQSQYPILQSWRWTYARMDNWRIPKQILCGELSEDTCNIGRPKLCFKDQCKTSMMEFSISIANWDMVAQDWVG